MSGENIISVKTFETLQSTDYNLIITQKLAKLGPHVMHLCIEYAKLFGERKIHKLEGLKFYDYFMH